jgi:dynein heavy chain, axonemal
VYENIEQNRQKVVDTLVRRYKSINPHLCKIEELVAGTNQGKSPLLKQFYSHWERELYHALRTV